ncbi:MAG: ParB/RepB/Spo0J family partition protein [Eubacterium sp.]|nr:ParB/RepB/Spo0J family partition protein [Eubacterium sp.]MBR1675187.1 ParB/RepB/Spo0J family partition protein [Eubacterium sp.]
MTKRRGLGMGMESLIPTGEPKKESKTKSSKGTSADSKKADEAKPEVKVVTKEVIKEVVKEVEVAKEKFVKITDVEPNKSQPRREFDEDALNELADSIKQFGIIEPVVVMKRDNFYEIIAGERRWRAARIAGLKEIPVIERNYSEKEILEVALIENLQRENLNPIEEAKAYQVLIENYSLKQDEVAERVSKSRTTITNSLRLLKLCDKVQQMLIDDMITTGHARCLIGLEDPEVQYEAAMLVFDNKMSVRETEQFVKSINDGAEKILKERKTPKPDDSFIYKSIEERLKNVLGTKAKIKAKKGGKGTIEIEYSSNDELDRITTLLYSAK